MNSVVITKEAVDTINNILSKESDVLIRYKKNKNEIEIFEQKPTVKEKIKITT